MLGSDIINLNVGGQRFSTSRQTLTGIPDTFFSALLSGRISSQKDETGAIFIDRDPELFRVILNFLRNRSLSLGDGGGGGGAALLHEAEYYGISPLVKQLTLCNDLEVSGCGDVLFYSFLQPPLVPLPTPTPTAASATAPEATATTTTTAARTTVRVRAGASTPVITPRASLVGGCDGGAAGLLGMDPLRVQMVRAHHNSIVVAYPYFVACYKQKESSGFQLAFTSPHIGHFVELVAVNAKMSSVLLTSGGGGAGGAGNGSGGNHEQMTTMIAVSYGSYVRLMGFSEEGSSRVEVGTFNLHVSVDKLFFIGTQLVALSRKGKIGVWNSMTRHWQSQEFSAPITSHDTAGSLLLLGSSNGIISYIDMQKFPLRMKDNDLLVTELYRDPSAASAAGNRTGSGTGADSITAISVFLTPKTTVTGNWIEIAYGTSSGIVRVIVHHPETVGHGPQLFQTFTVHRSPITKVKLSEELLVSLCAEDNHVRTWSVTRFRGMISTQPGSTSVSSFKIMSLEESEHHHPRAGHHHHHRGVVASSGHRGVIVQQATDCGPYGDQDDQQVFIQRVIPETDSLFVRTASNGARICLIKSVDGTTVTSFCVHECEGSSRAGSRSRRFIITGHSSGAVQMWDLTTALEFHAKKDQGGTSNTGGGPTTEELVNMLRNCDLSNSQTPTPCCISPSSSTFLNTAVTMTSQAAATVTSQSSNQTTRVVINHQSE